MPTNRYFNNTIDLLPLTKARSATVESNFTEVGAGFLVVETEMDLKAPKASPTFTGVVVLPATTTIGSTSADQIQALAVPTVAEITALSGVTSAIQTQINTKAPIASPTFTGVPSAPTPAAIDNTTTLATTEFTQALVTASLSDGANTPVWVTGTNYAVGKVVYSPTSLLSYRCQVAGVSSIDPHIDPVTWVVLGGVSAGSTLYLAANFGGF